MQWYTVLDVAGLLKLHEDTVRLMLKRGEIKHRRFGRLIRIPASELDFSQTEFVTLRKVV